MSRFLYRGPNLDAVSPETTSISRARVEFSHPRSPDPTSHLPSLSIYGRTRRPLAGWYQFLGLSRESLFQQGRVWGLFTYALLHGNLSHWLTNAYLIYYFGGRIHDIFGEREVWRVATLATLGGGVFHLLFQGSLPLVGASGAATGLLIALTTVSPDSKMFPLPIRARNLRNGIILGTVILLLMIPSLGVPVFGDLGERLAGRGPEWESLFMIGHACHLGGALAGIYAMRRYFRKPITLAQLQQERASREDDSNEAA